MKHLYIFRHGETDYNKFGSSKDAYDIDLNENGILQAKKLGDLLQTKKLDVIFSSPFKRAINTAKIAKQNINVKILINDGLREISYGDYAGLPNDELNTIYKDQYGEDFVKNIWKSLDPKYDNFSFPNGETKLDARMRILKTVSDLIKTDYDNIGISSHGGILKYLLFAITDKKFHIDNCELFELLSDGERIWME